MQTCAGLSEDPEADPVTDARTQERKTIMANRKQHEVNVEPQYNSVKQATAEALAETQDGAYTTEARDEYVAELRAGKNNTKFKRINMAFTDSNYIYLKTMARVSGISITECVNRILNKSQEENAEIYKRAKEFRDSIGGMEQF